MKTPYSFLLKQFCFLSLLFALAGCSAMQNSNNTDKTNEHHATSSFTDNTEIQQFIKTLVQENGLDQNTLELLFAAAEYQAKAVKLFTPPPANRPKPVKNWETYQSNYLTDKGIEIGVEFWKNNQQVIKNTAKKFGVSEQTIIGILGVETVFGNFTGNFNTFDTLATLAFYYPNTPNRLDREQLFRENLKDLLIWCQQAHCDPRSIQGSYAGAIGIPQFMPSSILKYATPYTGKGIPDIQNNPHDAIASIANYLKESGWIAQEPVILNIAPDLISQIVAEKFLTGNRQPYVSLGTLKKAGLRLSKGSKKMPNSTLVTIVNLPTPDKPTQYVLGLNNFFVITEYNHSFFYAMTVYELGQAIQKALRH